MTQNSGNRLNGSWSRMAILCREPKISRSRIDDEERLPGDQDGDGIVIPVVINV